MKRLIGLLILLMVVTGCSPSPVPINYGEESCDYCKMIIMQPKYGTELLTRKGKIYTFDSVECLVAFYLKEEVPHAEIHSLWVPDFDSPAVEFLDATTAVYLRSENLRSPMGLHLTAFRDVPQVKAAQQQYGGGMFAWNEVVELVKKEWQP
ncbi:MAG: nitrous oxide reductase [Gemmatimonadetes bacterium]|nr:MAG: nitrous oxide reductase [Gemmatimonadota bacterium]